METVRVAFVDVPPLLRDLFVALLAADARVEVQPEDLQLGAVPGAVAAGQVEVLVAGPPLSDPAEICGLLESFPRLKALVVLDEGRRGACYELRPIRDTRELSTELLVQVVQAARRGFAEELGEGSLA